MRFCSLSLFTGHVPVLSYFVLNCRHWLCVGACSKMEEQRQVFIYIYICVYNFCNYIIVLSSLVCNLHKKCGSSYMFTVI
jgi:hypothetical protein